MRAYSVVVPLSVLTLILVWGIPARAEVPSSVKLNTTSVQYSLTRNAQYGSLSADPYQMSFGVRRWLRPLRMTQDLMYDQTLTESINWVERYSGYGVLGHGEDVFTRQGAAFRRNHRGR
jgi:hypothetical protein